MGYTFHRRNLPHIYGDSGIYFITYRLINSLPVDVLKKLKGEQLNSKEPEVKRIFQKYDKVLDSSEFGENYLIQPEIVATVKKTMHYPDGKDFKLICYSVMPNHVHLVFELLEKNKGISKIMQSIKRISARNSNRILNRAGSFWQDESFDRLIRNDRELELIIGYVMMNPVKTNLIKDWKEWKHSYCHPEYQYCLPQ